METLEFINQLAPVLGGGGISFLIYFLKKRYAKQCAELGREEIMLILASFSVLVAIISGYITQSGLAEEFLKVIAASQVVFGFVTNGMQKQLNEETKNKNSEN